MLFQTVQYIFLFNYNILKVIFGYVAAGPLIMLGTPELKLVGGSAPSFMKTLKHYLSRECCFE